VEDAPLGRVLTNSSHNDSAHAQGGPGKAPSLEDTLLGATNLANRHDSPAG